MLDFTETNPALVQLVVTFASFFILPSLLIGSFLARGEERSKMNGLTVGVNGIGGAFFLLIGGAITSLGWRGVFWTYAFGLILFVLVLLFVPRNKPLLTVKSDKSAKSGPMPLSVYRIGLLTTGHMILYYVIPTNLASFVIDNGLRNSATSYLTSISFVFVFLAGIIGTWLSRLLGKGTVPFVIVLLGVAFLLMNQAHSLWMVAMGVGIVGFGFGFAYPILLNKMALAAPVEHRTLAVMLMTAFANIGQFISPLITNGNQSIFHLDSIRSVFMIIMFVLILSFIVAVLQSLTAKTAKMQVQVQH